MSDRIRRMLQYRDLLAKRERAITIRAACVGVAIVVVLMLASGCGSHYLGGIQRWDDPDNWHNDAVLWRWFGNSQEAQP